LEQNLTDALDGWLTQRLEFYGGIGNVLLVVLIEISKFAGSGHGVIFMAVIHVMIFRHLI
jgi:hypothetical protein